VSWLIDYIEYTKRQESPEVFHRWVGITTIAAALGRNVYLNRRSGGVTRYTIYPGQLMMVLVAASGKVKKTTAMHQAGKFIKAINKPIIHGKSSPEAFLTQLVPPNGTPQAILFEGELSVFLSKATYAEPLIDILIKLADAEKELVYNTMGHGKMIIPEPSLTMISATTPETLGERLPPGAIGSGFMSRVIFVYAKTTDRFDPLTDVEDTDLTSDEVKEMLAVETRLTDNIVRISRLRGPFTFTPAGRAWFDKWYRKWSESPTGQGEGYPSRRPDHMLRVAMCIVASRSDRLEIDERELKVADTLLHSIEGNFDKAFAYVRTSYAKDRQRIVDFIALKAGKAATSDIVAALYPYFETVDILKRTLTMLSEAGVLKHEVTGSHPPKEYWSLAGFSVIV
jgi:hypothetical protein